jgi:hypothetical protein
MRIALPLWSGGSREARYADTKPMTSDRDKRLSFLIAVTAISLVEWASRLPSPQHGSALSTAECQQ